MSDYRENIDEHSFHAAVKRPRLINPVTEKKAQSFRFPFDPYPSQLLFMQKAYDLFNCGGVGIFESPTGTGKTLCVLCSCLKWLEYKNQTLKSFAASKPADAVQERVDDGLSSAKTKDNGAVPDWVVESLNARKQNELEGLQESQKRRSEDRGKRAAAYLNAAARVKVISGAIHTQSKPVRIFEKLSIQRKYGAPGLIEKSLAQARCCDNTFDFEQEDSYKEELLQHNELLSSSKSPEYGNPHQVIICSRTHSQLSQYLKELKKCSFANTVKVVSIGSRKQMCVNPEVRKMGARNSARFDEACRLQLDEGNCEYRKNSMRITDISLSSLRDIEDLIKLGSDEHIASCPYFGSRDAAHEADVLLIPYACVLNSEILKSLQITLKGKLVIFDEAHNIMDALSSAMSASITLRQITCCLEILASYTKKYYDRLSAINLTYFKQLARMCFYLQKLLKELIDDKAMSVSQFLVYAALDSFNLSDILIWMDEKQICSKLRKFSEGFKVSSDSRSTDGHSIGIPWKHPSTSERNEGDTSCNTKEGWVSYEHGSIYTLRKLISSMLMCTADDRLFLSAASLELPVDASRRYVEVMILNTGKRFEEIVSTAQAVLLVSGTMEPRQQFLPLYSSLGSAVNFVHFTAPNIFSEKNIMATVISQGASGEVFDFRFSKRYSEQMMIDLALALFQIAAVVPDGFVVFFPSYAYMRSFSDFLSTNIKGKELKAEISKLKRFFEEAQSSQRNSSTDAKNSEDNPNPVFSEYASYLRLSCDKRKTSGAILFCVMGGKFSEGIDFADELARCVMIVGLPYPQEDVRFKQKLAFYEKHLAKPTLNNSYGVINTANYNSRDNSCGADKEYSYSKQLFFDDKNRRCYEKAHHEGLPDSRDENTELIVFPPESHNNYKNSKETNALILRGGASMDFRRLSCMKAINQSIGRAIRSCDDYAAIILVDTRFCDVGTQKELPSWISSRLIAGSALKKCDSPSVSNSRLCAALKQFFFQK